MTDPKETSVGPTPRRRKANGNSNLKTKSMSCENIDTIGVTQTEHLNRTASLPDPNTPMTNGRRRTVSDALSPNNRKKVSMKLDVSEAFDKGQAEASADATVGNVCRYLAVPPQMLKKGDIDGTTGSPKRGLLIFDASFESGNLGRVDCVSDAEYDLFVRPDTCNPKHRLWFNFTVDNAKTGQRVVFNFVNFSKKKSLFQEGMTPVLRTAKTKWKRISPKNLYYYKSIQHSNNYVMSFAHVFDAPKETYQFAYCFPYSYADLQDFLSQVESSKLPYFRRELLALSVQQRRLDLLTISDPENLSGKNSNKRRVVFITARVHPGETPSSYVCQGLLELLLRKSESASKLRKAYIFKVIPMLNPDGVALGNYRGSLMGFDLNRHWQLPSTWAHPTIYATKSIILEYNSDPKVEVVACLDLHAHSNRFNSFFYGNVFSKDPIRCDRQLYLPLLLSELAPDFSLDYTAFNTDSVKAGTSRRALGGALDEGSLCLTLEVSFAGFKKNSGDPSADNSPTAYSDQIYKELGDHLGMALYQYSMVESGKRNITIPRPFSSFVSKTKIQPDNRVIVSPNGDKNTVAKRKSKSLMQNSKGKL